MAATAERALGKATSRNGERTLGVAAIVALAVSALLSLVIAPPDAVQAWSSYVSARSMPSSFSFHSLCTVTQS